MNTPFSTAIELLKAIKHEKDEIILAEWTRKGFKDNPDTHLKVMLRTFNGSQFIQIQNYKVEGSKLMTEGKAVTIRIAELPMFLSVINMAAEALILQNEEKNNAYPAGL